MRASGTVPTIPGTPAPRGSWSGERRRAGLAVLILLAALFRVASAIPPHRLALEQVLSRPCRVMVARLTEKSEVGIPHGNEVKYRCVVVRMIAGAALYGTQRGAYYESWPYHAPDGKVEAPIYSGSGIEHTLAVGGTYVFIVEADHPETVLRVEPEDRLGEINRLLKASPL